jgi:hypothetical protein
MKPQPFEEQTAEIAKGQPEYITLPAHVDQQSGIVTFCWKLTWAERICLLITGEIWHQVMTFNQPLQPTKLLIDKPPL